MKRNMLIFVLALQLFGLYTNGKGLEIFNLFSPHKAYALNECTGTLGDNQATGTVILTPLYFPEPTSIPLNNGTFTFSAFPANDSFAENNPAVISNIQIQAEGYQLKDITPNKDDPCKNLQNIPLIKIVQTDPKDPGNPPASESYTLTDENECLPAEDGAFENQYECMVVLCDRVSNFPDEYSDDIKNSCTSYGQPLPTATPPLQLCQTSGNSPENCNTALGRISTDPGGFIQSLLGILLSISGMIALYLIVRSGYQLMTSRGNPEAIQEAKERLTSAIVGLLLIIFSLVIISVIGVNLLKIPGFGN